MTGELRHLRAPFLAACLLPALGLLPTGPTPALGQERGNPTGEWHYWGGDAWSTRYSPLDQIDASNFSELEVAWVWRGDNYGPEVDNILRATPVYAEGKLFTVAGARRTVVAMDPATGETLWTFREPYTERWERSMRQNYGKGVAYTEVDGRGVVYVVTPGFFLHALDAETGRPLEGWGTPVPIEGRAWETGVVDLMANLDEGPHDPYSGYSDETTVITSSSPPIVVNGVVIVGNSHEQGYHQTHRENVPGNILGYDAATGEHLWTFHVIPRPGEFGHETWESDAWEYAGNVSSWAPLSADPELGLVYVVTDGVTIDYYGGFYPGDNLFATSIIALDVETGERAWHFQTVHHDIWNYDNPTAPNLVDITVDGEQIPALVQTTKQAFAYVLNRETGEPVWPIEERPVPQSDVPGEQTSPTQPFPTRPAPYEMQGLTEDDLIAFTPELHQQALEIVSNYRIGPLFTPPALPSTTAAASSSAGPAASASPTAAGGSTPAAHTVSTSRSSTLATAVAATSANPAATLAAQPAPLAAAPAAKPAAGLAATLAGTTGATSARTLASASPTPQAASKTSIHCPGASGGTNIPGGAVVDPETGILYVASIKGCSAPVLVPGTEVDSSSNVRYVSVSPGGVRGPQGLPLFKPPYGRITAIDLNTGEHLWWIPNGQTPEHIANHPALEGVELPNTGQRAHATKLVTATLLMYGEGRGARPLFHAVDKQTGETLATVELPAPTNTAPMTFMHEGRQYIVVAIGGGEHPGSLAALRLPE